MARAYSNFCYECQVYWPNRKEYHECPGCGEQCYLATDVEEDLILTIPEAISRVRHMEFERMYPENPNERPKQPDRTEFDLVIAGAGYSDEEKAVIAELESRVAKSPKAKGQPL